MNKGAELMLVAIREHFTDCRRDIRLAVDAGFGRYEDRAKYGLWYKPHIKKWGRSRISLKMLPGSFARQLGIVAEGEIDVLLDASGFAFGDQHPAERSVRFARQVAKAKKAGQKVILLPQALGPFEKPAIRDAFSRIVGVSHLVFARDRISLEYARTAAGNDERIRLAPDFTNLVKPSLTSPSDQIKRVLIIPNQRMIEKAKNPGEAAGYISLLSTFIRLAYEANLEPDLLLHGEDDRALVNTLLEQDGTRLPVLEETDPVIIKKMIGESHLVIASRYHALVSALSQGVPAIGTSWSHKYGELFKDYSCPELIVGVQSGKEASRAAFEKVIGPESGTLRKTLMENAFELACKVQEMWKQVDACLGLEQSENTS